MKTLKVTRKSLRRFGIATASTTALSLSMLGGVPASAQQSLSPNARIAATPQSGTTVKPAIPYARGANIPTVHSRPTALAPIVVAKHPITGAVSMAAMPDLNGPGVALQGHIPPIATVSPKIGPMDETQALTVTFALKPRNQAEMDKLVKRLYDPKDPMFGHYLKPAERIARFSPTQDDFNKVVAFAQQKGLRVTDSSVDRQMIMATGTVGRIETALNTHLSRYKAADGHEFYAPESAPVVPAAIAPLILSINRLTDADIPRSGAIPRPSLPGGTPPAGGGLGDATPLDIGIWTGPGLSAGEVTYSYQLAYQAADGTPLLGQGQRVALVELGGFDQNDINYYIGYNATVATPETNLGYIPLQTHLMNGYGGQTNQDTGEVELDIEMLEAIASGLDAVDVYEEDYNGDISQELNQIMLDDIANQVSISYDGSEDNTSSYYEFLIASYTEEMALQGQAVFAGSGDHGAYDNTAQPTVNIFAASQYVTGVGGTSLWINEFSNYGAFSYEYPWNNIAGATGGGISQNLTIGDYQYNYLINDPNAYGSPVSYTNRNVPDVALDADPFDGYYTHTNGLDIITGGTSASTPIWAAFWAQLNQFRAHYGIPTLGFANPALYQVGLGGNYNSDFHDVYGGGNGVFSAVVGYDCTTGLGSIDGINMINDLVNYGAWAPSESLSIAQSQVTSGQQITLSVNLESPVPSQGYATVTYAILSGNILYGVGQDTLNPYASSDTFNVTAPDVKTPTTESYICYVTYYNANGTVLGGNHWSNYASVLVNPNALLQVTIAPSVAYDGQSATGTVTLVAPAAQNELMDLTSSDPTNASVPATVTVPAGASSVNFAISTKPVATAEQVYVTASPDASSGLAFGPGAGSFTIAPLMSAFSIAPTSVIGGTGARGSVTLAQGAPANLTLHLTSSDPHATVPATVKVPAGQTSVTFTIATKATTANVTATITVNDGKTSRTATLNILAPTVKSLGLNPAKVVGPATVIGKATLTGKAPKGGLTLTIASSSSAVASAPSSVIVAQGSESATFPIRVVKVTKATKVTITVTDPSGTSKTTTLTVNP